jgi:protein TonB
MVCFLLTWSYPQPAENLPIIVTIRILETEREKNPLPPAPIESKPKIVPKQKKIKPDPPKIVFAKEAEDPSPPSPPVAEPAIHEVTQFADEKKIEEPTEDRQKQEPEPAPLGVHEGRMDKDIASLGREGASPGLIEESGSAEKGVPGGLPLAVFAGEGAGKEGLGQGSGIGEKGAIPSQGVKTGSALFHGEGERKGKRDLSSYLRSARLKIESAKRYPREARRRGWEGKVVLSFQINQNGDVGEIAIVQSSSYRELDEEGITTIRRAAPFLPPPLGDRDTLEIRVPLVFKLE